MPILNIRILFFLSSCVFLVSCKKTFKPAEEAFFITSNQVHVKTKPGQGFGSNKITELWLYTNGFFRGAYPIGSKMPIMIQDGKSVVDVFAGIKNNGISETRINWLLYEPYKLDTVVKSGENIVRDFEFKYRDAVVFKWVEGFELPGFSLIKSPISDTTFKVHTNNADVFEGNKSIEFGLSGAALTAQLESAISFSLPMGSGSGNVYLEIDYKANTEFVVGAISNGTLFEALSITPKEDWNKVYVQLSTAISTDNSTALKKIFFKIRRNESIPEQKVFLDNIKLVYL